MSDDEKTGSFVVKDRRRFDSEGNERAEDKKEEVKPVGAISAPPKAAPEKSASAAQPESSASNSAQEGEINFSSFVMSLATQALMQLGEIKPPPGVQIEVDKDAAMQTIEILAVLQAKTKGNLDSEETHLMEGILHNLRLSFVRASK